MMVADLPALMASASSTTPLAVALALLPVLAGATGPVLMGSYRAEPLGRLELRTEGSRLQGVTAPGNACNLPARQPVLEGVFEGPVLVGTVTLCQTGPGCEPQRAYPVLAVYSPADGSLTAHVRLKEGCQSPALQGGRLLLAPRVVELPPASAQGPGSSAASVARRREKGGHEVVAQALTRAEELYRLGAYDSAARHFQEVLELDANNPVAHHGLGAILLQQGQPREAIRSLERARTLNGNHPSTSYLLACAWSRLGNKRQGLESLRQAVRLGYPVDSKLLSEDSDLQSLLGSEAELEALLRQARARKPPPARDQDPPEPSAP